MLQQTRLSGPNVDPGRQTSQGQFLRENLILFEGLILLGNMEYGGWFQLIPSLGNVLQKGGMEKKKKVSV